MWASRFFLWLWRITLGATVWELVEKGWAALTGLVAVVFMRAKPDLMTSAVKEVNDEILAFNPIAVKLSAETLRQIAGLDINPAEMESIITAPPGRDATIGLGDAFLPILNGIFDIPAANGDFRTRTGFAGSAANMSAFFGTNLTFQLRSLTISTISSMFGFSSLRHLEGLHQTINWAFGFGWLSWAVMSNIMDVAVNPGMRRYYNSQVLPNDLNSTQAIDASLRGFLDPGEAEKVLANNGINPLARPALYDLNKRWLTVSESVDANLRGYRTDAQYQTDLAHLAVVEDQRAVLLDLGEAQLSEADIQLLFDHGRIDQQDVFDYYRKRGFRQARAEQKTNLVLEDRTFKLLDAITESHKRLYRDGVIGEDELRQWLSAQNYDESQANLVVALEELERRQRSFLSDTELGNAVDLGIMSPSDMLTYLQFEGLTDDDAIVTTILQMQKHLPACEKEKVKQDALIAFLQNIGLASGVSGHFLRPQILKYLQCLGGGLILLPPTVSIKATPHLVNADTVIRLEWTSELATKVSINHGIGDVDSEGATEVLVRKSTSYIVTATNPFGKATDFAFVQDTAPSIP